MAKYYVNSVTGDDGNDGLSVATPLQTLSALVAKQSSGVHSALLTGTFTASNLDVGTAVWYWRGVPTATISVTTKLFSSSKTWPPYAFIDLAMSGDTAGWLNAAGFFYGVNLTGKTGLLQYSDYRMSRVDIQFDAGDVIGNLRGTFAECRFHNHLTTANNGLAAFVRCVFTSGAAYYAVDQRQDLILDHCTIVDSTGIFLRDAPRSVISNCVFARYASSNTLHPVSQFGGVVPYILDSYGYQASPNANISTSIIDFSELDHPPYADPSSEDWTVSAELAAIVGPDGLTPGAIQATGGSGGGGTAGFTGIRGMGGV